LKTTLLVINQENFRNICEINLNCYVGAKIDFAINSSDALEKLETNNYGLVVTKKIILDPKAIKIPHIELGLSSQKPVSGKHFISNSFEIKPLIKTAAQILNVTADDMYKLAVPEFYPFASNIFKQVETAPYNIYQKIDGEYKLLFPAQSKVQKSIIELLQQNDPNLYVEKNNRLKFVNYVTCENIAKIKDKELNNEELQDKAQNCYEHLKEKIEKFGITDETVELAKKNIKTVHNVCKKYPNIKSLLSRLLKDQSNYLFKHTQLITYFGMHLLDHLDWGAKKEVKECFSYVAFFHDIALETQEQAEVSSNLEYKNFKGSEHEKNLINRHAQIAAELVSKMPKIPPSVDLIIKQHHGILNGLGFSDHYSGNLSPLAITFIICEELTTILLEQGKEFNESISINMLREKFSTKRFEKIINSLEKIMQSNKLN
jgi:HD-GYP domain-containing protein (c-di-GMP phosphodiesterase class II)